MSTTTEDQQDGPSQPASEHGQEDVPTEAVLSSLAGILLGDDATVDGTALPTHENKATKPYRRAIVYTRSQMLQLYKSPLVKCPDGMPSFKDWFGEWNEQNSSSSKKDSELSGTNGSGTRDRRYRRDVEDGDSSARSFRSALSQPSQMGNFKHQSIRGERDRDRGRDAESELRTLSDKFDRERNRGERLGLPSNSTLLRNRDRETAPHLAASSTSRTVSVSQDSLTATSTRRSEGRDGAKRRTGESEDWRRGVEPTRQGRDERSDRRDREDRDKPRSRVRDSSRQPESPPSRRDRDRDRDTRDKDRDRRSERDRDGRDRDRDRFEPDEDPRRWRDDGKRDERLAQRREKDKDRWERVPERDRRGGRERSREAVDKDDRENPITTEDRDTRMLKRNHRDRRYANAADEGKEKEREKERDRDRDRDDRREREREKEPAWMETYVPSPTGVGILGGQGVDGEVDGIQAWKKDMKERELKGKGGPSEPSSVTTALLSDTSTPAVSEAPLDEIQLFKLMMKREEQKRSGTPSAAGDDRNTQGPTENGFTDSQNLQETDKAIPQSALISTVPSVKTTPVAGSVDPLGGSNMALSPLKDISKPSDTSSMAHISGTDARLGRPSSGIPLKTAPSDITGLFFSSSNNQPRDPPPPSSMQFEPPRQSRLLAFGAKSTQSNMDTAQNHQLLSGLGHPINDAALNPPAPRSTSSMISRTQPVGSGDSRLNTLLGGPDPRALVTNLNALSDSQHIPGEHTIPVGLEAIEVGRLHQRQAVGAGFMSPIENHQPYTDNRARNTTPPSSASAVINPAGNVDGGLSPSGYSTGKGSRFAKFFDGKAREQQGPGGPRGPPGQGLNAATSVPPSRQDMATFAAATNESMSTEQRNFGDLLAMLSNSAQRASSSIPSQGNGGFQNLPGMMAQQQQQQQQQQQHNLPPMPADARHDSYEVEESRYGGDGLVPGIRPSMRQNYKARSREASIGGMYAAGVEEALLNTSRLQNQQRQVDPQLYNGHIPSQLVGQIAGGRNMPPNFQQQSFRANPSPINNFNPVQGVPQQRVPPGLANLGGRPPHDASQYLGGGGMGMPSQNLHNNVSQQPFNQFAGNGNIGLVGGQPHMRGPAGAMGQLGGANLNNFGGPGGGGGNVDFRNASQAELLSLGANNSGMRMGPYGNQHVGGPHMQNPSLVGMRQQQQQAGMQPAHLQQMLPPQMQQGYPSGQRNQNDLMALLMGGGRLE